MYIDIHAHLDFEQFENLDELIPKWKKKGMRAIIANGLHKESNERVENLAKTYDIVYAACGFHPVDVLQHDMDVIQKEIKRIQNSDCVAIGEVGLDYKYATTSGQKRKQQDVFKQFIELSKQTKKPLIIHSRKAERDTIDILKKLNHTNAVLHCFSGKKKYMKEACTFGLWFSAPSISDRGQQFKDMTKHVPLTQLLTETDSPFLSPYPKKHNDPTTVKRTITWLSTIKKRSEEEIKQQIKQNTQHVFNITIKNT